MINRAVILLEYVMVVLILNSSTVYHVHVNDGIYDYDVTMNIIMNDHLPNLSQYLDSTYF